MLLGKKIERMVCPIAEREHINLLECQTSSCFDRIMIVTTLVPICLRMREEHDMKKSANAKGTALITL